MWPLQLYLYLNTVRSGRLFLLGQRRIELPSTKYSGSLTKNIFLYFCLKRSRKNDNRKLSLYYSDDSKTVNITTKNSIMLQAFFPGKRPFEHTTESIDLFRSCYDFTSVGYQRVKHNLDLPRSVSQRWIENSSGSGLKTSAITRKRRNQYSSKPHDWGRKLQCLPVW